MASYADVAAKLLRDAATLFRALGEDNPDLADTLQDRADIYDALADRLEDNPHGEVS